MGVSGAPEKVKNHAEKIMDMAMDMRDCVSFVKGEKKLKGYQICPFCVFSKNNVQNLTKFLPVRSKHHNFSHTNVTTNIT